MHAKDSTHATHAKDAKDAQASNDSPDARGPQEVEAKYAITGSLDLETLSALDLSPYALRAGEDGEHHDLLLDTSTRAITGGGYALRLREEGDHTILTLKGPGHVSGSVHRREEIEALLLEDAPGHGSNGRFEYSHWPSVIADRVAGMVGGEQLAPLVETHIHRRTWVVEHDGRQVGELALDEGTIEANGQSQPVYELELELKGEGDMHDLALLDVQLRRLLPLQPEPRSKLQRGLALLGDRREMSGRTPLTRAGRHTIKGFLKKIRKHEPKVRQGGDPDAVHDMRVATRRLRSALLLLEDAPVFDKKDLRKIRRHLRGLSHELGAVRDLDVFQGHVADYERGHPEASAGVTVLRDELARRYDAARATLLHHLDSGKLERRLDEVADFTGHVNDASREVEDGGAELLVLVRHYAPSAIWRGYEEVLRFECVMPGAPPPTLHRLRIACKRLRYALEMFAPALGAATEPLVETLMQAQDHLGSLQDAVVALQTVDELREQNPENVGLAMYARWLASSQDELRPTFEPLWLRLSGAPFRRDLAALLAGL
jgi:inorganic triphosphatase YgiF